MAKNLIERLDVGPVLCAEGYLFAMERRGYLSAGAFVPEVVLEHPEVVSQLHREFIRAGSEIVQAFTYYGHREKLRLIGERQLGIIELNPGLELETITEIFVRANQSGVKLTNADFVMSKLASYGDNGEGYALRK